MCFSCFCRAIFSLPSGVRLCWAEVPVAGVGPAPCAEGQAFVHRPEWVMFVWPPG